MNIRESLEEREQEFLSPYAAHSRESRGRERPEEECDIRTVYQRDRDRILHCKAFGDICERIKKMKLKEGSFITLCGDYDEERWTDKTTGEVRSAPVISLDDIKFSHTGGQKKEQNGGAQDMGSQGQQGYSPAPGTSQSAPAAPAAPQSGQPMQMSQEMPQNFTGYESFSGGQNPFFPG